MPIWKYSGIGSSLIAFLMGTVAPVHNAAAQTAGTVGSVNNDAKGTPPGRSARDLSVGQNIVQNERIQTNANGTTSIIFNDRSALNIGRNSNVAIDRFVYDANAGAGSMAISMSRGAARFVGGQVSHTSGAEIKTPAASIGVRGGNVSVAHDVLDAPGATIVIVHNGVAQVSNAFGSQSVRSGFEVIVPRNAAPGTPTPVNINRLRDVTRLLASQGSQTGGARQRPDDANALRNNIGTPRAPATSPNFDLPAVGDDLVRGHSRSRVLPYN
jgi:FecR protein